MDPEIIFWILEFLLRRNLKKSIICKLISLCPVPSNSNSHLRVNKTILLNRISHLISTDTVSESILKALEFIEQIDHQSNTPTPQSIRNAYSSVAVECAAKFLRYEPQDYGSFADAVNRIWKGRISSLRRWRGAAVSVGVGLVSDELWDLEKEMTRAVDDAGIRSRLCGRDTRKDAVDSVRVYLGQAYEAMGPSFLEFASQLVASSERCDPLRVLRDRGVENAVCESDGFDDEIRRFELRKRPKANSKLPTLDLDMADENDRHCEKLIRKGASEKSVPTSGEQVHNGRLEKKFDILSSPEVTKAQRALKLSSEDLQTVVQDPLPTALEMAAGIAGNVKQTDQVGLGKNQDQLDIVACNTSGAKGGDGDCSGKNERSGNHNGGSWQGFMARNKTAHTLEWGDDVNESLSEESPSSSKNVCLPTPKGRVISPLKRDKYKRRRKVKRWSSEEEQKLREAVALKGKGNWKLILECYSDDFEGRTEVDLKDKWRNMTRY